MQGPTESLQTVGAPSSVRLVPVWIAVDDKLRTLVYSGRFLEPERAHNKSLL